MAGSGKLNILLVVLALVFSGYLIVAVCILYTHDTSVADHHTEVDSLRSKLVTSGIELISLRSQLAELVTKKEAPAAATTVVAPVVDTTPLVPQVAAPVAPVRLDIPETKQDLTRWAQATRKGVVVLGMHRSGTSVTGGLLSRMGLKTGGPLIGPAEDNKKGFFERIDVVLQNDYLLKMQGIHYASGVQRYDWHKGLMHAETSMHMRQVQDADPSLRATAENERATRARLGTNIYSTIKKDVVTADFFNEGSRAMSFFFDPGNSPWMLKDPRLCITLRTWIPLLGSEPAVLFTYRHPLDVALSLHKRDRYNMPVALRMWYVYNWKAVVNSADLCRVVSSHHAIMASPDAELSRIHSQLKESCGVPIPHKSNPRIVAEFVDTKLNHGKHKQDDCTNYAQMEPPVDVWKPTGHVEMKIYRECLRVYCAMESGKAFLQDFPWDTTMSL